MHTIMNDVLLCLCVFVSCFMGFLLKKLKKKEIFNISSKYYHIAILCLNILILFLPMPLLKKYFSILLVPFLIYQCFLDYETMELSDVLSGIIFGLGLVYILIGQEPYHFITALILLGIYVVMSLLGPVGFGDVKLVLGLGLFVESYVSLLFYPFLFAVIFEIIMRLLKKNKHGEVFAFGPYIVLGFYFAMLFIENFYI